MVMKYEINVATAPSDVIAFRATDDPMLMQQRRQVTAREKSTAGRGIFQPGETCIRQLLVKSHNVVALTLQSQLEPGNPRSRANAQIWRDDVAVSLMQQKVNRTMMIAVMTLVAA